MPLISSGKCAKLRFYSFHNKTLIFSSFELTVSFTTTSSKPNWCTLCCMYALAEEPAAVNSSGDNTFLA